MVVFGKGGKEAGSQFIENCKLFLILPTSEMPRAWRFIPRPRPILSLLKPKWQEALPNWCVSVGIENIDDIIADVDQAIAASV